MQECKYMPTVVLQLCCPTQILAQELSQADKEEAGRVPRTLEVELTRDLVDSCSAGDVVTVLGIIKVLSTDAEAGMLSSPNAVAAFRTPKLHVLSTETAAGVLSSPTVTAAFHTLKLHIIDAAAGMPQIFATSSAIDRVLSQPHEYQVQQAWRAILHTACYNGTSVRASACGSVNLTFTGYI